MTRNGGVKLGLPREYGCAQTHPQDGKGFEVTVKRAGVYINSLPSDTVHKSHTHVDFRGWSTENTNFLAKMPFVYTRYAYKQQIQPYQEYTAGNTIIFSSGVARDPNSGDHILGVLAFLLHAIKEIASVVALNI
jgi:hypothetical protein